MYKCSYPVEVISMNGPGLTNCKRCLPCRLRRQNELTTKLWLEMWNQEYVTGPQSSLFLTFTYSDDFLPDTPSQMKKDLRRFFIRLQRNTAYRQSGRYVCIGEAGPSSGRLHAHAILFGAKITPDSPPWFYKGKEGAMRQAWLDTGLNRMWTAPYSKGKTPMGFLTAYPAQRESMRYVSRYGLKDFARGQHLFTMYSRNPGIGVNGAIRLRELMRRKEEALNMSPTVITHLEVRNKKGKVIPMFFDRSMQEVVNEGLVTSSCVERIVSADMLLDFGDPDYEKRERSFFKSKSVLKSANARKKW